MARGDGPRRPEQARVVAAAITHVSNRVLALQRVDEEAWLLPGGPVAGGEALDVRLRQYVRAATGFEIKNLQAAGSHETADGVIEFVRCEIRGVGADITSRTRTLRWMDRAAIVAHMDPVIARSMLAALAADDATSDSPTLLAS